MALNFPSSPIEGQVYAAEGATYSYTNGRWTLIAQSSVSTLYLPLTGGTLTGNLMINNGYPAITFLDTSPAAGEPFGYYMSGGNGNLYIYEADAAGVAIGTAMFNLNNLALALNVPMSAPAGTIGGIQISVNPGELEIGNYDPANNAAYGTSLMNGVLRLKSAGANSAYIIESIYGTERAFSVTRAGTIFSKGNLTVEQSTYFAVAAGNVIIGSNSSSGSELASKTIESAGYINTRRTGSAATVHAYFTNKCDTTAAHVGNITTNGSATSFVTTSDELLKTFTGLLDPQRAIDILRADPPREFDWKNGDGHGVGWGAQTSYAISPDLAVPPPEWVPDEEAYPGVRTAPKFGELGYQPWGMDLSKRVPYLAAALVHALDRIDELTARMIALESV